MSITLGMTTLPASSSTAPALARCRYGYRLRSRERANLAREDGRDLGAPLPLCMADSSSGSSLNKVELISSNALPDLPGKRVTVVRVTYGPGGFTLPHRHAGTVTAYITKGQIRSQLKGGPVEIFDVGQSFFEPPGAIHLVSANASNTDWAELIAVFVADEGAQLTTLIEP